MNKWKNIKFQFEVLGASTSALASEHSVSAAQIENAAETEGWVRQPIAGAITEWKEGAEPEALANEARDKAVLLHTLRHTELLPKYFKAESAVLDAILRVAHMVEQADDEPFLAAKTLKSLSDAILALRPQAPVESEEAGSGITINIASGYGDTAPMVEGVCVNTPKEILPS